jgi:GntR family transcriptional repressor for pyruvate dehydrogenase complex
MINQSKTPLHKSTLADIVTRELRRRIQEREFAPGEFLPPRKDLAAQFGVGLSTIQEATQALIAVGLLESRPGKGTWVPEDALDTFIHPAEVETRLGDLDAEALYEARLVVEVGLAELAATHATEEDLRQMRQALDAMQQSLDDDQAFIEADLAFHLAVARAGHNVLLEQFYHLSRRLLEEVIAELIQMPDVKENGLRIQREIAQAIEAGDPEAARQATLDHMDVIRHLLDQ